MMLDIYDIITIILINFGFIAITYTLYIENWDVLATFADEIIEEFTEE